MCGNCGKKVKDEATTTMEDNITKTTRGTTKINQTVTEGQFRLNGTLEPITRIADADEYYDLGDGYSLIIHDIYYVLRSPTGYVIFPCPKMKQVAALWRPLIKQEVV